MELLGAWQEKTSSAKYATAPKPKASNYVLSAASFPMKPPSKDQSAMVTASTFLANPKIVSFKFAVVNL
jgi:hypothetical protein